jgi:hypothetical protein
VSTDHYAEGIRLLSQPPVNATDRAERNTRAAAHLLVALVDAVRDLKAGATVTTTHVDLRECPCKAKEAPRG